MTGILICVAGFVVVLFGIAMAKQARDAFKERFPADLRRTVPCALRAGHQPGCRVEGEENCREALRRGV